MTIKNLTKIKRHQFDDIIQTDESMRLFQLENDHGLFFATPYGKREVIDCYRGQLIVRNTVKFTGMKPQRKTTVYIHVIREDGTKDLMCEGSDFSNKRQAEKFIDEVLDSGELRDRWK